MNNVVMFMFLAPAVIMLWALAIRTIYDIIQGE